MATILHIEATSNSLLYTKFVVIRSSSAFVNNYAIV